MDDQVLITGSADGGLSELDKKQFETCSYAFRLAPEIGQFGHPPEVRLRTQTGQILVCWPTFSLNPYGRGHLYPIEQAGKQDIERYNRARGSATDKSRLCFYCLANREKASSHVNVNVWACI